MLNFINTDEYREKNKMKQLNTITTALLIG